MEFQGVSYGQIKSGNTIWYKTQGIAKKKRLTQEQLAEKSGLHWKFTGLVEKGINIKLGNIEKLAKGLGMPLSELLETCFSQKPLSRKAEEIKGEFLVFLEFLDNTGEKGDLRSVESIIKALRALRK